MSDEQNDGLNDFLDEPSSASVPEVASGKSAAPRTPTSIPTSASTKSSASNAAGEGKAARSAAKAAANRIALARENALPEGKESDEKSEPDGSEYDIEEPGEESEAKSGEKAGEKAGEKDDAKDDAEKTALIARAKAAGFSEQAISDFAEDLEGMVSRREARAAAEKAAPAATPASAATKTPAASAPNKSNEDLYAKLETDGIDKDLVTALRARDSALQSQFAEIQAELQAVRSARAEAAFDQAFNSVPENLRGILGSGATDALPRDSSHFLARIEVAQECSRIISGYEAHGEKVPPLRDLIARATKSIFSEKLAKQRETELLTKVEPRQKRFTTPPSARRAESSEGTPDQKSLASINRILREANAL